VCYVVLVQLTDAQFENVREVHRTALAADRAQVITAKATIAHFCARPGVVHMGVCEAKIEHTVSDLRSAIN
ncbi:hypothetical protein TSOC_012269, partial [Tetrabaena socialis]